MFALKLMNVEVQSNQPEIQNVMHGLSERKKLREKCGCGCLGAGCREAV